MPTGPYQLRADVEGTIRQGVAVTGIRHARYRGLPKTHLQNVASAAALNLIRLDAWFSGIPPTAPEPVTPPAWNWP